jgi:serine/threonine-protein kinase
MRMAGRLDHPNIVRAYDADRVGDRLFIAMELIRGASLEEHLRSRGPLPPADVVRHAARAASGLAHAHGRGVVHRDVKPANILLNEAGDIKLLDFGLGVLAAADDPDGFATEAAMIVGTANFLSPEQACGRPVDGRSDLYSLGCTMYYLLCGELPFPGDSPMERIAARLVGTPVPISDLRPGLCPRVVGVINRLMARQPEDRFEDAAEAEDELDRLLRPGPVAPASVRSRRDPAANDSEGVPPPGRSGAKERPEAPRRPRITRLFRALFATRAVPTAPRAGARATA